jgi:transcriptional regulator with XRE-family HTH domain
VANLKPHAIVGRSINRLRNAAGLTQESLAERAGIDIRSLQRIEAGEWNMTIDYLDRLRTALQCRWVDLIEHLDGTIDEPPVPNDSSRGRG